MGLSLGNNDARLLKIREIISSSLRLTLYLADAKVSFVLPAPLLWLAFCPNPRATEKLPDNSKINYSSLPGSSTSSISLSLSNLAAPSLYLAG